MFVRLGGGRLASEKLPFVTIKTIGLFQITDVLASKTCKLERCLELIQDVSRIEETQIAHKKVY